MLMNNTIVETKNIEPEELLFYARKFELVIDISQMTPTPQVGWLWDESNKVFVVPNDLNPSRIITRLAFLNRLTDTELQNILTISRGTTPLAVPFESYLIKLQAASFVDLARADTIAGVQFLANPMVQAITGITVLTSQRVIEILTNPVQLHERPVA